MTERYHVPARVLEPVGHGGHLRASPGVTDHLALFAWGFSQAKSTLRRKAAPALAAFAVLVVGLGAIGAWHDRTHTDYGEPD